MSKANSGRDSPVGQEAGDASSIKVSPVDQEGGGSSKVKAVEDDKGTVEKQDTDKGNETEKDITMNGIVKNNTNDADGEDVDETEEEEITDGEIDAGIRHERLNAQNFRTCIKNMVVISLKLKIHVP